MRMRTGVGWQYALTDLSLILFLIAAQGLTRAPAKAVAATPGQSIIAEPVAVWRQAAGGPSLSQWLSGQPRDPRQRLTITARYAGTDASSAAADAARLLAEAGPGGGAVRLLVEPGPGNEIIATLTWDVAQPTKGTQS